MKKRPLSPHLSIYKWQISNSLSILHRISGVALYFGIIISTWIIVLLIYFYDDVHLLKLNCKYNIFLKIVLFGWSFAFFYHMFNGIRHLFWDRGKGYELKTMRMSGILVIIFSITATILSSLLTYNIL
ncbi:MAG: succinate dehydrogenase, cytochrome b556 subunit [Rickettsiales bacterium]|nr:MAG: succinate dehydrogenase, cytochrome b556 subunit [Rickettsiales bacterium]